MFHTLEEWCRALVDNPTDQSLRLAFSDWTEEQGFHNFDVGDKVFTISESADLDVGEYIECLKGEKYILLNSISGKLISVGRNKFCMTRYRFDNCHVYFREKCFCSNDEKHIESMCKLLLKYTE